MRARRDMEGDLLQRAAVPVIEGRLRPRCLAVASPSGPSALKRTTQSRTICRSAAWAEWQSFVA